MGFFGDVPAWVTEHVKLSRGGHNGSPTSGACIMEFVSLIATTEKKMTDQPQCVNDALNGYAISINDSISADARQKLIPYAHRFVNTKAMPPEEQAEWKDAIRSWVKATQEKYGDALTGISAEPKDELNVDYFINWGAGVVNRVKVISAENGGGQVGYENAAISFVHAMMPKDRPQAMKDVDFRGAWTMFTKAERVKRFGEEAETVPEETGVAHLAR